jgi:hypothetical protein
MAGGSGDPLVVKAEVYDPQKGTFSAVGDMTVGRQHHTATLLQDGRVLITGGSDSSDPDPVKKIPGQASAELFDPHAGVFGKTVDMTTGRLDHTATMLPNGQVLIAGGRVVGLPDLATAELFDPKTGGFDQTGTMATARINHTATLLPDGRVLIAGGSRGLDTAELYDPKHGGFTLMANSMTTGRAGHTATLLPDGRVLLAGGTGNSTSSSTAELFEP